MKQLLSCLHLPVVHSVLHLLGYITVDKFHEDHQHIGLPINVDIRENNLNV